MHRYNPFSLLCGQPGYEAEETIKRIKSHKGVQAVLIVNQEGVPIYSSTNDDEFAMDHAALISQLAAKAKSTIRTLDPTNDMTFLRIRSKKHEIMIAPGTARADKDYALIVIQNPNPGAEVDTTESN
ncbi:Myosin protein [Phytophthora nicotianae]|uniref:Myosin protein n=1 Tax=Phytophthora nicotianae TaxID=4792 RepID=A0A0W8D9A0_PHYNI|nr:Myosin protein [Phytophthora nicotianae]